MKSPHCFPLRWHTPSIYHTRSFFPWSTVTEPQPGKLCFTASYLLLSLTAALTNVSMCCFLQGQLRHAASFRGAALEVSRFEKKQSISNPTNTGSSTYPHVVFVAYMSAEDFNAEGNIAAWQLGDSSDEAEKQSQLLKDYADPRLLLSVPNCLYVHCLNTLRSLISSSAAASSAQEKSWRKTSSLKPFGYQSACSNPPAFKYTSNRSTLQVTALTWRKRPWLYPKLFWKYLLTQLLSVIPSNKTTDI